MEKGAAMTMKGWPKRGREMNKEEKGQKGGEDEDKWV